MEITVVVKDGIIVEVTVVVGVSLEVVVYRSSATGRHTISCGANSMLQAMGGNNNSGN